MISERTLKRWRKEALKHVEKETDNRVSFPEHHVDELNKRILRMTQELLDLHLIKK